VPDRSDNDPVILGFADPGGYLILRQPPIRDVIPAGGELRFNSDEQLFRFYKQLGPSVQKAGLWITPSLPRDQWIQADLDRMETRRTRAVRAGVTVFLCEGRSPRSEASGLVAWQCRQAVPRAHSQPLFCEPRESPGNLGHPHGGPRLSTARSSWPAATMQRAHL
jgi:hypothetical protein